MAETPTLDKLQIAQDKKNAGNTAFKEARYKDALRLYHESILFVSGIDKSLASAMDGNATSGPSDAVDEKRRPKNEAELLIVACYNNMAAIHLKLGNWKRALESADKALAKDEENAKAGFRKAQALANSGDRMKAIRLLEDLKNAHPQDPDIARELNSQKRDEEKSELEHEKSFKEAWKGKFSFNRKEPQPATQS